MARLGTPPLSLFLLHPVATALIEVHGSRTPESKRNVENSHQQDVKPLVQIATIGLEQGKGIRRHEIAVEVHTSRLAHSPDGCMVVTETLATRALSTTNVEQPLEVWCCGQLEELRKQQASDGDAESSISKQFTTGQAATLPMSNTAANQMITERNRLKYTLILGRVYTKFSHQQWCTRPRWTEFRLLRRSECLWRAP